MFLEIDGKLVNLKAITYVTKPETTQAGTHFLIHFNRDLIRVGGLYNEGRAEVEHTYRKLKMALGIVDERNTI